MPDLPPIQMLKHTLKPTCPQHYGRVLWAFLKFKRLFFNQLFQSLAHWNNIQIGLGRTTITRDALGTFGY